MRYSIATNNFLRGFGRALDVRGSLEAGYARRARHALSDHAAIASDWDEVWSDLGTACDRVMAGDPAAQTHEQ
jgi:hypothetical protein